MIRTGLILNLLIIIRESWQIPALSSIISVSKEINGQWKVNQGIVDNWIVVANFTDTQRQDGWMHLDISSRETEPDEEQAVAAGLAEGFLTSRSIYGYYKEFIHSEMCGVDPQFCEYIREKFQQNIDWMEEILDTEEGRSSSYWKIVRLFHKQLEGLRIGWLMRAEVDNTPVPPDFDVTWFAYFINFYPDIGDYIYNYKQFKKNNTSQIHFSAPSCSVLIKKTHDDILVGHATWHVYKSMSYRVLKKYNLNFHTVKGELIPGHTVAMSSYAGNIFSLDDYYTISSGLAALETTLFVYDTSLMANHNPRGQVWEPIRVMTANRLATSGQMWTEIFSRYNSGTYNNQWMVVDYNRKSRDSHVLWVAEQLPGKIVARDMTETLSRQSYWASYNRAIYDEIFELSGAREKVEQYGDWFTHDKTPRALLFKEKQSLVTNLESLMTVLRSNEYSTSAYSTPPGCNGPIPSAAIASRSDLQMNNVSCTWQDHDFMVGSRAYGATDAKVMSSVTSKSLSFMAVAGPTTHLRPFSWSESNFDPPLQRPIDKFEYSPLMVTWNKNSDLSLEINVPQHSGVTIIEPNYFPVLITFTLYYVSIMCP